MTTVEEVRKVAEKSFLRVVLGPKEGLRRLHLKSEDGDAEGQVSTLTGVPRVGIAFLGNAVIEWTRREGVAGLRL